MKVSLGTLGRLLNENVAEIKFARRKPKPGLPVTRRMLCTNSSELLYSTKGQMALNFRGTSRPPKYNPATKNLHITWDIFMQDYRTINLDSCQLISLIPADEHFWTYFAESIAGMTPEQKQAFMNT